MNWWEQDSVAAQPQTTQPKTKNWWDSDPAVKVAEPPAPAWGDLHLGEQFGTSLEMTRKGLALMFARDKERQALENDVLPGFQGTDAGAVTGLVRPSAATRNDAKQAAGARAVEELEPQVADVQQRLQALNPPGMTWGQKVVSSVAQSAAPTLAGVAAGVLTANPAIGMLVGTIGGGMMQGAGTYLEAMDKGASHEEASRAGGIDAILEGVGEALPLHYALKEGTPIFKRIFGTMAREAGQEAATQAMQDLHAFLTYNPDITVKEAFDNLTVAAGAGALMGGPAGALGHGIQPPPPLLHDAHVKALKDAVDKDEKNALIDAGPDVVPTSPAPQMPPVDPTLLTPEHERAAREGLAASEARLKQTPPNKGTLDALGNLNEISPAADLGELGESRNVVSNAKRYANENELLNRTERTVLYAPEGQQDAEGLQLQQVELHPGVYTVGEPTEERSAETLRAQSDMLEQWRKEFMPDSTFVMLNETLPSDAAVGWYQQLPSGVHVLTPAALRNFSESRTFNINAQAKVLYNMAHEFGHALTNAEFFKDVDPWVAAQVRSQSYQGQISEDLIRQFDEARSAVLREFNAIRAEVNKMTAKEFRERWMNPHKIHKFSTSREHHVPDNAPAMQLVQAIVGRGERNAVPGKGLDQIALRKMRDEYLGIDEFLAEQTSRYAYAKRWDQKAPKSVQDLIGYALQSTRDVLARFFKSLKKEGVLAPGTKFSEWLDSLSRYPAAEPKVGKAKLKKPAAERVARKARVTKPAAQAPPVKQPVELDHNVATRNEARAKTARSAVVQLTRDGSIELNGAEYKDLMALIKNGDWIEFNDRIQPYIEKKVQFEIEDDELPDSVISLDKAALARARALAAPLQENWKRLTKISEQLDRAVEMEWDLEKYPLEFASYQGMTILIDNQAVAQELRQKYAAERKHVGNQIAAIYRKYEERLAHAAAAEGRNQEEAAKTWKEEGFASRWFKAWFGDWETDPENSSKVLKADGTPLVVYHGTVAPEDFDQFNTMSHFGTVRSANERLSMIQTSEDVTEAARIYPVVLNLRNPLNLSQAGGWVFFPEDIADNLREAGILTTAEAIEVIEAPKIKSDPYRALRDILEAKGYDGIRYENPSDGDTAWIAFRPEQVKSVLGTKQFNRSPKIQFELEYDEASERGYGAGWFQRKFKGLVSDQSVLRHSIRWFIDGKYKLLQLQQLAHLHPELPDLGYFDRIKDMIETFKGQMLATSTPLSERLRDDLSKEQGAAMWGFLEKEMDAGVHWMDLTQENGSWMLKPNETFYAKLRENGIDPDTPRGREIAQNILDYKNSIIERLGYTEKVLNHMAGRRYAARGQDLLWARDLIAADVHKIRSAPFMPRATFGKYLAIIERKKQGGRGWETVHREGFESRRARERWMLEHKGRIQEGVERMSARDLTDTQATLLSVPTDFIDQVISELDLQGESIEQLHAILEPIQKERALKSYDRDRLKIKGGSKDYVRAYANYMWHDANLLSKLMYRADLNLAIQGITAELRKARYNAVNDFQRHRQLELLTQRLKDARDIIMYPPKEWHFARMVVGLAFLMFNPKTAALNMYWLSATQFDLIQKVGVKEGVELFTKAMAASLGSITLSNLDKAKSRQWAWLPKDWQPMLDQGIAEGQLAQSYAYYIAGVANASNLNRMPGYLMASKFTRGTVNTGMWMFRLSEFVIRRATFLAEYELEKRKDAQTPLLQQPKESPYQRAIATTKLIQGDYAASSRPPFLQSGSGLRRLVPMATVFMAWTQTMAFHAYGGYELGVRRQARFEGKKPRSVFAGYTMMTVALVLLLAGYEGLPGMENVLDLLDFAWKKLFGKSFRQGMRENLRDFVRTVFSLDSDPMAFAHGLGHSVFGADVSRSIGFGRIFPGTDSLAQSGTGDYKTGIGELVFDLAGPAGSVADALLRSAKDITKGQWPEDGLKRMPGAIGNVANAYYWSKDGVKAPDGSHVTFDLKTGELRDLTTWEIAMKVAGFNPTVVSQNREVRFAQHDLQMYYSTQRSDLFKQYFKARQKDDREAIADVRSAVDSYNESLPEEYSALRIKPKELTRSYRIRQKTIREEERGNSPQKRYRALYQDVRESFDGTKQVDNP